jgi:hypothetical protein
VLLVELDAEETRRQEEIGIADTAQRVPHGYVEVLDDQSVSSFQRDERSTALDEGLQVLDPFVTDPASKARRRVFFARALDESAEGDLGGHDDDVETL